MKNTQHQTPINLSKIAFMSQLCYKKNHKYVYINRQLLHTTSIKHIVL